MEDEFPIPDAMWTKASGSGSPEAKRKNGSNKIFYQNAEDEDIKKILFKIKPDKSTKDTLAALGRGISVKNLQKTLAFLMNKEVENKFLSKLSAQGLRFMI